MSIIDTFDDKSEPIVSPKDLITPAKGLPEIIIGVFSKKFIDVFLKTYKHDIVSYIHDGIDISIYKFKYKNKEIGLFQTIIGGAVSAGILEEVIAMGGRKFLYFGSAGSLNKNITSGHLVVPTEAYRDEGTSYHYMAASDYIKVKSAEKLAEILDQLKVPYIKAKTWTTDAMYRETRNNMLARKKEGCAVVEMECASLMAAGGFRNVDVYEFVYAADCLDGEKWDKRILGSMNDDMKEIIFGVAAEIALRL